MSIFRTALYLIALPFSAQANLSEHTEDVLLHVIAHEMGHALIREFDLPVLGNEEVLADAFATVHLHHRLPEDIGSIVEARVRSLLLEDDRESVFAEHPSDARRAGQILCLAYGLDPETHEPLAQRVGMTRDEAANCRDSAPEIARAWRRLVAPLERPSDAPITEVRTRFDDLPVLNLVRGNEKLRLSYDLLTAVDWHSQITLAFRDCDDGAGWNRNGREITICHALVERFEEQAAALEGDR